MSSIVREEASKKLGKYVLLPIIKINVKKDVPGYIDSYLNKDNNILLLTHDSNIPILLKSEFYLSDYSIDDDTFLIIYKPSQQIKEELDKFRRGLWSKFTADTFDKIKKYSGLPYKKLNSDGTKLDTHTLFLAIEKSEILRKSLESELKVTISRNNEYMQKPSSINFAEFEDFFNEESTTNEQ